MCNSKRSHMHTHTQHTDKHVQTHTQPITILLQTDTWQDTNQKKQSTVTVMISLTTELTLTFKSQTRK